jgi:asparagine synthase (glutamine-hydrolysing)
MCGIWTFINLKKDILNYNKLYENFMKIKHRGPDFSNFQIFKDIIIGFHRLAIMDLHIHANQPYIFEENNKTIIFICNGEIYNYKELIKKHEITIINNSDCMVIPKLYLKYNTDFYKYINEIKGEYAFILLELDNYQNLKNIIIGRDEIGIRPLYYNSTLDNIVLSSEIKGICDITNNIQEFEPGTLLTIELNGLNEIINKNVFNFKKVYLTNYIIKNNYIIDIRNAVINSIKRRLESDKPIAFLLSGGIDSSIVCAVASKILNYPIKTFCCGMKSGTDFIYAKKVAEHIGSIHTEVLFTCEEGLDAIDNVIYTTETWDTTTIRASVGQYLVCKYISSNTDAKVILVGEGPDEVCSSYLFNYYAPEDGVELDEIAKEYVKNIHMYDGRRADRCISNFGLEARIPLLDPEFITSYWEIPCEFRHPKFNKIEKWYLRKAFEDILPNDIIFRKKEAFSDGVSNTEKSWYQIIQEYIDTKINIDVLPSKEAYYYKMKYKEYFNENNINILSKGYWKPWWTDKGKVGDDYIDPSARTLNIY